ncbi:DUF3352 domain-containing protein [Altericista sp. CCNU0014]|uniref:DUF3352 domain-containing protein n=1 Tax=Altericista sp. CCNU0014 TaxID=3082949 RepID=UPI003850F46E
MNTARRAELRNQLRAKRMRSLALTLGGAAFLVVGGTAAYFLLNGRQSESVIPFGAAVTPQTALLSLTASTNEGPWRQLGEFGTPETKTRWKGQLKNIETDFLEPFGLSYDKDIRPWVGSQLNLVLLSPAPEDVAKVGANAAVWFLPMRDPQQARSVVDRAAGSASQKRTYKDVEVQTFQGQNGKSLSAVVLENRLLVVSNGNNTLNQVIDTYRGAPSLAQTPRLQEAMKEVEDSSAFAQVYVNLPIAAAGLLQNAGRGISQSTIGRIQAVQGIGASIEIENDGLNFKAISWLKPDAKQEVKGSNKTQTLARLLPGDTLAIASGVNFQQAWQDHTQGTESQLIVPLNPSKIQASLLKSTGLDFEKEFASWMDGEFIAAVVPTANSSKQGVGMMLLAKANDRAKADRAFQKLDTAMRDRHNFLVAESKVGNRSVTTWKVPPNLPLATHGWLDNNVAFFTFGAPISERILTPQNNSLADAALFQKTRSSNLTSNTGQFFVDLPRAVATMQNSPLLPKLAPTANQIAQAIEGIGMSTAIHNAWSTRYDFTVKLKRQ